MHLKSITVWIFVLLMLLVALMFAFPTSLVIGISIVAIPILVAAQAFVILRSKEESDHTFSDKWYDEP